VKNIVILGGGIIGLCSGYYLSEAGHKVTIIDKGDLSEGCSYGNAGMIVPSHIIPLAQPGLISKGIKWMFDSKSPFYVEPRLNWELISWGLKFYKYANDKHVTRSMPALRDLSLLSKNLYKDLSSKLDTFYYQEKGLLMLFKTEKVGEEEYHAGKEALNLGLEVDFLEQNDIPNLETGVATSAIGAVHYKSDAHLYPQKFMSFLKEEFLKNGGQISDKTEIENVYFKKNRIQSIQTNKGLFEADDFVLAAGSWSPELARLFNTKLSILPGKGYSFTLKNQGVKPEIPSILCEGKVAVTPMANDLRFGGTMEITHTGNTKINKNRVQGIVNTINEFYPNLNIGLPKESETWYGFRPCTPSGMPIIDKSDTYDNLILATGHAMMGLSLAPATGKLVQELVDSEKLSVDTNLFKI
jgi:D-amino-acid dehydrogenase